MTSPKPCNRIIYKQTFYITNFQNIRYVKKKYPIAGFH